jgi:hypothetical protein
MMLVLLAYPSLGYQVAPALITVFVNNNEKKKYYEFEKSNMLQFNFTGPTGAWRLPFYKSDSYFTSLGLQTT